MTVHASKVFSGFEACDIQIFNPRTNTGDENFNPWTNDTGSDPILIWSGSAQMQVFRQTLTVEIPAGGMTQIRSARFTISDLTLPPVPKGFVVKIVAIDSNLNEDAANYQYTVTGGLQAPYGFTTTLECEVDMGVLL
jgi:hypothetical protein